MRGARRNPIADSSTVAGSTCETRISARRPALLVCESRRMPARAIARFSSSSGTTSATVASATRSRWRSRNGCARAEQRLRELPDDPGPAQPDERVVALQRRDDGTRRKGVPRPVVVGDDDGQTERPGKLDLGDGRDPAVDGQDEVEALLGEAGQCLAVEAVPLLEARRQMPGDVGPHLAQQQDGQRRRADPVGVVVAVDADALARLDRGTERGDSLSHVAEPEWVVSRKRTFEEGAGLPRLRVAAADEHRRGHLVERERRLRGFAPVRAHMVRAARSRSP